MATTRRELEDIFSYQRVISGRDRPGGWQDKCFTFDMDTAFVVDQCESESDIRPDVTSNDVSVKSMTR